MADGLVGYSLTPRHVPESLCEIFTSGFQGEHGMNGVVTSCRAAKGGESLAIAQGLGDLQSRDLRLGRQIS